MPWATGSTPQIRDAGYLNERLFIQTVRIDVAGRGKEQGVYAFGFQFGFIGIQSAWVGVQIFVCTKLHRVNKNRYNDDISQCPGLFHQFDVTVVQISHGWDERNTLLSITPLLANIAQGA